MAFPQTVQREMGYALFLAQMGESHPTMAKPLKGFGGGSVVEIKAADRSGTFRAVYTVRFADAVFVLHAFQKKSKKGSVVPKTELASIERRLKQLTQELEKHR